MKQNAGTNKEQLLQAFRQKKQDMKEYWGEINKQAGEGQEKFRKIWRENKDKLREKAEEVSVTLCCFYIRVVLTLLLGIKFAS